MPRIPDDALAVTEEERRAAEEAQRNALNTTPAKIEKQPATAPIKMAQKAGESRTEVGGVPVKKPIAQQGVSVKPAPAQAPTQPPAVKPAPLKFQAQKTEIEKKPSYAVREGEEGMSVPEIMAKRRLDEPSTAQKLEASGVRRTAQQLKDRGMDNYVVDKAGRRTRKVGAGEARRFRKISPEQRQAESDWATLKFSMQGKQAPAATLDEYRAQFKEMVDAAGAGAEMAGEAIQEDFEGMMPDEVRREYNLEKQQEDVTRESEFAAERLRRQRIAEAEATRDIEESGLGVTLRSIGKKKTKADLEAKKEFATATGDLRREQERLDILNSEQASAEAAGNTAEARGRAAAIAEQTKKVTDLQNRVDNAGLRAEAVGAEREAEVGVETGLIPAETKLAKEKKAAALDVEEEAIPKEAQIALKKEEAKLSNEMQLLEKRGNMVHAQQKQLREIQDSLPLTRKEKAQNAHSAYKAAFDRYELALKREEDFRSRNNKFKDGRITFIEPERMAEQARIRKQAEVDMEDTLKTYNDSIGAENVKKLETMSAEPIMTNKQRKAREDYDEGFEEVKGGFYKTTKSANRALGSLDKNWLKTGRPIEEAPHRGGIAEVEDEAPPEPTTVQMDKMTKSQAQTENLKQMILDNPEWPKEVVVVLMQSAGMDVPEFMLETAQ